MKRLIRWIGVGCLIAGSVTACARQQKINGPLMQGRELEKQGEYVQALRHYENLKDAAFREMCIQNLRYLYGDILDALTTLQAEAPVPATAYYALGAAYYEKFMTLPTAQTVLPTSSAFDATAFAAQQRVQMQTQALAALETATQMQPSDAKSLLLQGIVYEEQGAPEQAKQIYQQMLDRGLPNAEAMYRLAYLTYPDQPQQALDLAAQAVAQYPAHPHAHFSFGVLSAQEGNLEQAVSEFEQTVCLDAQDAEAYYRLAQIFLGQQNLIDAERVLRFAVQQNPASQQLGLFYAALKTILDEQELASANAVYQQIGGTVAESAAGVPDLSAQSPTLQLAYQRLRLRLIQRQRPYRLPCTAEAENPYFANQLQQTQTKLTQLEQVLLSTQ